MDNTIFAQSITAVRFKETKMLDKAKIEALVEAGSFEECVRILQDTGYDKYVSMSSYEEGLKLAIEELYKDMYKTTPVRDVVDILSVRYDGHNIKSLIKAKFSGFDVDEILINAGMIPVRKLKYMIEEENFRDMPEILKTHVEQALKTYREFRNPQMIDIAIDKGIYEYMLKLAVKSKMPSLITIVKLMIDVINIKSFVRIKIQNREEELLREVHIDGGNLNIDIFLNNMNNSIDNFPDRIAHTDHFEWVHLGVDDYMKYGNLDSFEKYGDNYIINYLKNSRLISFGPEPLIAYIIWMENEIRTLRIILTGKKNDVEPEAIKERLRDIDV